MPPDDVEQLSVFLSESGGDQYRSVHRRRYIETYKRLRHLIVPDIRILEFGEKSAISAFIERHANLAVQTYEADLRYPIDLPDSAFDLILMLEVLEHLKDCESSGRGDRGMFTFSGAVSALGEAHRLLAPGGNLIVTTPNGTSVDVIGRLFVGEHAFLYPPHVREYAPVDVTRLAESAGFRQTAFSTFFAWHPIKGVDRAAIMALLRDYGADAQHRGDDAFFIFAKSPEDQFMTEAAEAQHRSQWERFKAAADELIHGSNPMYGLAPSDSEHTTAAANTDIRKKT